MDGAKCIVAHPTKIVRPAKATAPCVCTAGFGGNKLWAPRTLLVMTHADVQSSSSSGQLSDSELYEQLLREHSSDIILEPHVFRLDAHQAMGAEMKLMRQTIASIKKHIVEVLPASLQ